MAKLSASFPNLKPLHRSGSWAVFATEVKEALPEEHAWTRDLEDFFVWSTVYEATAAVASRKPDGTMSGEFMGGQGVEFEAQDFSVLLVARERAL